MSNVAFLRDLGRAVAAGHPLIRVDSDDHDDAWSAITGLCAADGYVLLRWTATDRLVLPEGCRNALPAEVPAAVAAASETPSGALALLTGRPVPLPPAGGRPHPPWSLPDALREYGRRTGLAPDAAVLLVMQDLDTVLCDAKRARETLFAALRRFAKEGKQQFMNVVALCDPATRADMPTAVRPLFTFVTHDLPDAQELGVMVSQLAQSANAPAGTDWAPVARAAVGLTRVQAENVFAEALQADAATPSAVMQAKFALLNLDGLLTINAAATDTFATLPGYEGLKRRVVTMISRSDALGDNPYLRAKGVLLVGPPGTGKTSFARALGAEVRRLTVEMNVSEMLNKWLGQSEARLRQAFRVIRALAGLRGAGSGGLIVLMDEFGRELAGGGGEADGGVQARLQATLLREMADMREEVFWVLTANSMAAVDTALTRDGRISEKFYVGPPGEAAAAAIWQSWAVRVGQPDLAAPAGLAGLSGAAIAAAVCKTQWYGLTPEQAVADVGQPGAAEAAATNAIYAWAAENRLIDADTGLRVGVAPADASAPADSPRRKVRPAKS